MRAFLAAACVVGLFTSLAAAQPLSEVFRNPPEEAKPRGYWVWPHGNFDYATLRRELEEYKAKGLGGVDIFDLGIRNTKNVIPPGPGFMSPEQVDGIAFALAEAKRLNLKMGLIVSSSWNAGGTWTPPELAMMNLVSWKEIVEGPAKVERVLPFPEVPDKFKKPYGTYPLHVPKDDKGLPVYRKEMALVAYPVDAEGRITDPAKALVLNDKLDAAGKLTCDVPAGRWLILRTVVVNFGQRLWLPSDKSQGLTMDHFSKAATQHHFKTIIERLEKRTGPLKETALERLYLASYEANSDVTWTPGFEEEFAKLNGYRIEPYLPALYGMVVVDRDTTDRFLYDYRRTVSELFVNNLYREASRICRGKGLLLCSEAGGPGAPLHHVPTEELKSLGSVDVMRGEFWNGRTQQLTPDGFEELQIVKPIASAAHIYGHRIVEMEAFTSTIHWQEGPEDYKKLADRAFCEGMTRVVYHTMTHNLPEAGVPGWTYQAGSHMNTNLTWWDLSHGLHQYLARCSALLMQGNFVADVALYYGDDVPLFAKPKHLRPGLGYGYDYDDLNTEMLLRAAVNAQGQLVLPGGMRYELLVLPEKDTRMSLAVAEKIEQLINDGATVLGPRPERTFGLRDAGAEQTKLREIADRLWGAGPFPKTHGKGRLFAGTTARQVLEQKSIVADFDVLPVEARAQVDFIHRRAEQGDLYFLRNSGDKAIEFEGQFRARDRRPELWEPVSGVMTPIALYRQSDATTKIPLHLPAWGSVFVVFLPQEKPLVHVEAVRATGPAPRFDIAHRTTGGLQVRASAPGAYELVLSNGQTRQVTIAEEAAPIEVAGPWEVRFPAGWDVPPRQAFDSLKSWTDSADPATRAFSGIAVYTRQVDMPAERLANGQRVLLDLGVVREVARVYLNGREAGISSFAPHVLDVTSFVRPGENSLAVEVGNTWLSRLIFDDAQPEAQRKTRTNIPGGPVKGKWRDATPKPSGLLGPVRLRFPAESSIELN